MRQGCPSFSTNEICSGPSTWSILNAHYVWGPVPIETGIPNTHCMVFHDHEAWARGEPAVSLQMNQLKFETSGELSIILEESLEEYTTSVEWKHNRKMSTCNRLDLKSLGCGPTIYAQKLLEHWCELALRATSHTRLKALDHGNVRALIGRKGGDRPSSLHTRRWRPRGPKKSLWMKSLHGVLHG